RPLWRAAGRRAVRAAAGRGAAPRVPPLRGGDRAPARGGAGGAEGARRGGAAAGVPPGPPRPAAGRLSRGRPPVAPRALDPVLPDAGRHRGGRGGGGAARGAGVSMTVDRGVAQPLGAAAALRGLLRAALVVLLFL